MKNISCSLILLSILGYSGGDILPVEPARNSMIEIIPKIKIKTEEIKEPKKGKVVKKILKEIEKPNKAYIGLSAVSASFDSNINGNILNNAHPYGLMLKGGYQLVDNLSLEARVARGITSDKVSTATDKWKSLYGIYLKPEIRLVDKINIFGLLGYSVVNETVNGVDNRSSGVSYGLGTSYAINNQINVVMDLVRYASTNNQDSDGYSLGFEYKF